MKSIHTLLVLLLVGPSAAFGAHPGQQMTAPAQEAVASTEARPGNGVAGEAAPDYLIGPGDSLHVFVWREPDLSGPVVVRSDGKVTTPLVEDIVAVGLTPSGLARAMEERLARYIKTPQVNIIVTGALSAFSKITVIGQVGNPQTVPYRQGMTALDVVLAVGGLGEFAAANRAEVIRKDATGKETKIRVKLGDLIKKGRTRENIEMRAGDILVVPESVF